MTQSELGNGKNRAMIVVTQYISLLWNIYLALEGLKLCDLIIFRNVQRMCQAGEFQRNVAPSLMLHTASGQFFMGN